MLWIEKESVEYKHSKLEKQLDDYKNNLGKEKIEANIIDLMFFIVWSYCLIMLVLIFMAYKFNVLACQF